MKKIILIILIYLFGCFCAYNYCKFNILRDNENKTWSKQDRNFSIFISTGSWVAVISMGFVHFVTSGSSEEKSEW